MGHSTGGPEALLQEGKAFIILCSFRREKSATREAVQVLSAPGSPSEVVERLVRDVEERKRPALQFVSRIIPEPERGAVLAALAAGFAAGTAGTLELRVDLKAPRVVVVAEALPVGGGNVLCALGMLHAAAAVIKRKLQAKSVGKGGM
ncbi:hypothetical protein WJX81_007924 [Elliptochloris bilobata]|uniref:Uncharacterized protein n=1 Tax=Elliptochloris bilobata TaxID=381761 RepID=A0AAW1R013_9CHLO